MTAFLVIQGTYQDVRIGLFNAHVLLNSIIIKNSEASKQLIVTINTLLNTHNLSLNSLSFIAANQGPAPFTTLRTILTTVNGINFASKIPLIGIDTLKALADEWHDKAFPTTVVLLEAFNNDVYYHIQNDISDTCQTGYKKIDSLLEKLAQNKPLQTIRFIGNAALLYQSKIEAVFASYAYFPTPIPSLCSLLFLGEISLKAWHIQQIHTQLAPLYLKKHQAEIELLH